MCQLYISMETFKKIGPYFVYTIGLYSLFSGVVSAFLLQPPSEIRTADSSREWGEWSVLQTNPVCVLQRQANCSKDHCDTSEFKFCKDIVQWGEWAPSGCKITNNACFISRIRSCSIPSLKTCDSSETNADIQSWGDMSTCPCRTEKSNWLEWSAWECHDNLGCLMVRRRTCPNINGCAGDSYELDTCKVDRCDQFVTWNTWGEWNCNPGEKPCVRYRHRSCSSGHDIDCQMIGGCPWNMKPCDDTCNPSTTLSPHLTTYFTKASLMTMQTTSDTTSTSSLSTAPTTVSAISQTSVLTTSRTNGGKVTTSLPTKIDIAQWGEWAPTKCKIVNNACFISSIRSCSVPSLNTCGSTEHNIDIKYWGDMTTCPCRTESTESTPDSLQIIPDKSNWLEWNAWECHDNIGCLMVRRRTCPHKTGCAGDSYELDTCKVDRCNQFVTWNSWGEWNCHTEATPCVRYKQRNCSSGHASDCQSIGGTTWDMQPCDDTCTSTTESSTKLTTKIIQATTIASTSKSKETASVVPFTTTALMTATQSNTKSTTKITKATTIAQTSNNNDPVTCKVCAGPEFLCEKLTMDKQCDYPNNYCVNKLSNHKDGTRTVIKSCGNYDTCYHDWFLGSSDSDKCRKFDDNNIITLNFACTYCCTTDLCNDHIRPLASTWFTAV